MKLLIGLKFNFDTHVILLYFNLEILAQKHNVQYAFWTIFFSHKNWLLWIIFDRFKGLNKKKETVLFDRLKKKETIFSLSLSFPLYSLIFFLSWSHHHYSFFFLLSHSFPFLFFFSNHALIMHVCLSGGTYIDLSWMLSLWKSVIMPIDFDRQWLSPVLRSYVLWQNKVRVA